MEAAGADGVLNTDRLRILSRPRMEKMAAVVQDWDATPEVIMAACFELARKNNHPDGPMPNMLLSVKYLTKALSEYFQVPYEAISQKRCMKVWIDRVDWDFKQTCEAFEKAGITDVVTATSYPVEYRYLMAVNKMDWNSVGLLAMETLEAMKKDRRAAMWLEHRGVRYEKVAAQFNKWKKTYV
jgi:hypothetical protein